MCAHYAFVLSFKKCITLHSVPFIWFGFVKAYDTRALYCCIQMLHFFSFLFCSIRQLTCYSILYPLFCGEQILKYLVQSKMIFQNIYIN